MSKSKLTGQPVLPLAIRSLLVEVLDNLPEHNPQWPAFDELDECPAGHRYECGACELRRRVKEAISPGYSVRAKHVDSQKASAMTVFLIGGPLDGELREVPDESIVDGVAKLLGDFTEVQVLDRRDYVHRDHHYHIANGIARHESVSEEEVARRVHGWLYAADPDYGATDAQRETLARLRAECSDDR